MLGCGNLFLHFPLRFNCEIENKKMHFIYQLTCLNIYTNLLIFVFFHVFMSNNSLKLVIKFPTSKVSGYFTILFTKVGTIASKKTIFTQIVKNCKTFPTVLNWALRVHANSQGCSQNCWIPLRS